MESIVQLGRLDVVIDLHVNGMTSALEDDPIRDIIVTHISISVANPRTYDAIGHASPRGVAHALTFLLSQFRDQRKPAIRHMIRDVHILKNVIHSLKQYKMTDNYMVNVCC